MYNVIYKHYEGTMDNNKFLQKYKLKSTPQRLEIINILTQKGHSNVETLYNNLKLKFPSVSLSTVYKNINTMQEKGFLSEVKINGKKNVYELIKNKHSHAVCMKCHKVIDIKVDASELLYQAKQASNYKLNESSVVFQGICPNCK